MSVATPPLLHYRSRFSTLWVAATVIVVAIVVTIIVTFLRWPFTEKAIISSLEDASSSKVTIAHFQKTYFPHPGCIAENVVFVRLPGVPPLITIPKLTIQASFLGLFTKHVSRIQSDGMTIFIPPQKFPGKFHSVSNAVIDDLLFQNATLQFGSRNRGQPPLAFSIHECILRHVGGAGPVAFRVSMSNPQPPGEIDASGRVGPWHLASTSQTPVSGNYTFQHADLGVFDGIAGILSSSGTFEGTLKKLDVHGTTETPDFEVTHSGHKVGLKNKFDAVVNTLSGDVTLEQVDSMFRDTRVITSGTIARRPPDERRITELEMLARNGRIQDILGLFVSDSKPPMAGITSLRAHVFLPADQRPFLSRVELHGDFGIDEGKFTATNTQQDVNKLSAESLGQSDNNPATVLSDLKGHAEVKDGVARFSDLSFGIPGASAEMHGTYNLISEAIDLHGVLKMDTSISHTAHGPKALLLKFMDPFFKRKPKGSAVPVKITGTYDKPLFGLDLGGQKENKAEQRLEKAYHKPTK